MTRESEHDDAVNRHPGATGVLYQGRIVKRSTPFTMRSHGEVLAGITAVLEFSETGYLRAVFLNAESDGDQAILERALFRLMKPGHLGWIRRLLRQ